MKDKIIVEDSIRLSNFIGTKLTYEEDLLLSKDDKVLNFLKKYSKYIYSNKIEDIKEFYNLSGLMLTHIYSKDDNRVIYSMNNIFRINYNNSYNENVIYTTHLLVVSEYDDNNDFKYYNDIYLKNKQELQLGNDIRYTLSCICSSIKSRISTIEKKYDKNAFKNINKKDVKLIKLTMLNNLCILLKNGDLYLDGKLYAKNVETIWSQDSYSSYIIYKDNSIELLTSIFPTSNRVKHKKIVYNEYMLASLYKNRVHITIITDQVDACVMTTLIGVDDIYCTKESLYLLVGNKKVRIPSTYNTIIANI